MDKLQGNKLTILLNPSEVLNLQAASNTFYKIKDPLPASASDTSFDIWFDPYCAQTVHAFLSWVSSDMHSYEFSHSEEIWQFDWQQELVEVSI